MNEDIRLITERHQAFLNRDAVKSPLLGMIAGSGPDSWSYWQSNPGAAKLWGKSCIQPEDVLPEDFVEAQRHYLEQASAVGDDLLRAAMPFASLPWMEAALGCSVVSTNAQFASQSHLSGIEAYEPVVFDAANPWVRKYMEFLDVYSRAFDGEYPIGQSVLRGVSDLFAALFGPEQAVLLLMTQPEAADPVLRDLNAFLEAFYHCQMAHLPEFAGGHVIGQYELWAPGSVARIQEDNASLLTPDLYREHLKPLNAHLAENWDYTLMHIHASAIFMLDELLDIKGIRVFQVSKDEGGIRIEDMLPSLVKIQEHGRCLLLKGRFSENDVAALKKALSPNGLCVQPVVPSIEHARAMLPSLRRW